MSEIQIQSDFFVHMADWHVFSPFILWYYYPIAHFYKYFFILYFVVFILNYVFSPWKTAASTVTPAAPLPQLAVSPVSVAIHRKEDRSHVHSSPGSPVVFTQHPPVAVVNESSSSHSHHSSHQQLASSSSIVSSSPLSHSSNASSPVPVVQPAAPTVNLQTVAKYVDKNLISHLSAWPTEAMDRQVRT